jgi:hypothetical protein
MDPVPSTRSRANIYGDGLSRRVGWRVCCPDSVADPGMIFTLLEQLVEGSTLANCQVPDSPSDCVWVSPRWRRLNVRTKLLNSCSYFLFKHRFVDRVESVWTRPLSRPHLGCMQDLFSWVERRRDTLNQEILWKRGKVRVLPIACHL